MAGSSSSSEKHLLAELRFEVGQLIKYGKDPATQKFAVKTGRREYVDAYTYFPIPESEIIHYLADSSKSEKATVTDIERVGNRTSELMKSYRKNLMTVDFETAFIGKNRNVENADIFTMGLSSIDEDKATGTKTLRGREYYAVDIFDSIIGNPDHVSNAGYGKFATMSDNVKAGYFKQFSRLAARKSIDMSGIENFDQLFNNREKLRSLLGTIKDMEIFDDTVDTEVRGIGKELGVSRYDMKAGLGRVSSFANTLDSEMNSVYGNHTSPVLGTFNPSGVDEPVLKTIYGPNANKQLSLLDIRGRQLFINSTVFPQLIENLHVTLGPQLKEIAHRMRFSEKQTKMLFENMQSGIAGIYTKSTAAEDIEKNLRYALGHDSKLTHRPTSHGAVGDAAREARIVSLQSQFVDRAVKESVRPELHAQSVRARFISAYIADQTMNAAAEGGISFSKANPKWKSILTNRFNNAVDMKKLSMQIQSNIERSMSYRFEAGILKQTTGQFGGNTIAQLLGGAMMFAGVRVAVAKAQELFNPDDKANSTEGLRHDSILTVVNRLANTEFGSGYLKGFAPAIVKVMKAMFKNSVTDPTGMPALVKNTLSKISSTMKDIKGNQSLWKMLTDPDKLTEISHKVIHAPTSLSATPSILEEFTQELASRNILGETGSKMLFGAMDKAADLAGHYRLAIEKTARFRTNKTTAFKEAKDKIVKGISEIFVTRGKDEAIKLKAPAIAIGLGGVGAIGIMLSRNSYDPDQMYQPMRNQEQLKYRRDENRKARLSQQIHDIRMSGYMEGISLGSRVRQSERYSKTDFGSGYRLLMLKMNPEDLMGIAKRGKNAIVKSFKGTVQKAKDVADIKRRVGSEFDYTPVQKPLPTTIQGIKKSVSDFMNKLSPNNKKNLNVLENMKIRDARQTLKRSEATRPNSVAQLATHVSETKARSFKPNLKKLPKSTSEFKKVTVKETEQLNGAYTPRNKDLYQLRPNSTIPNKVQSNIKNNKLQSVPKIDKTSGLSSATKNIPNDVVARQQLNVSHAKDIPEYSRTLTDGVLKTKQSSYLTSGIQRVPETPRPIQPRQSQSMINDYAPQRPEQNRMSNMLIRSDALSARISKHGKMIRDKVPHGSNGLPFIPQV